MKQKIINKRLLFSVIALGISMILLAGCGSTAQTFSSDSQSTSFSGTGHTVMKVDGDLIPLSQARVYELNYQNIYGRMYGADMMENTENASDFNDFVKDVSITALARTITMSKLAENQEVSLDASELKAISDAAKEYYASLNDTEREYIGADEDDIASMYEDYALANHVYEKLTDSVNAEVSDDESRIMRVKRIYITDESKAKKAKKELDNGTDFDVVASEYNEKDDLDIAIGRGDFSDSIVTAAFNLEDDEISDILEDNGVWYILKCVNKFDEELSESNKLIIANERKSEAFNKVYDEYRDGIRVTLVDKVWDSEAISKNPDLVSDSFFSVYEKYM